MNIFRYVYRGLFGPKCPSCGMRDFEWKEDKLKIIRTKRDDAWELHCNACGADYWKFKGSDNRLFKVEPKKELSHKKGDHLTTYELDKMTNTFDGRVVCPDCEHYPLCAGPCGGGSENWSCTNCWSEFNYMGPLGVQRISDRMPDPVIAESAPEPEPDKGFLLGGSL